MNSLHRVIDAVRGRLPAHEQAKTLINGPVREHFLLCASRAECFDFGELHFEPSPEREGFYSLPAITKEETEFFREGLIPLPAPICWFEYTLGDRVGLMVYQHKSGAIHASSIPCGKQGITVDGIYGVTKDFVYADVECIDPTLIPRMKAGMTTEQLGDIFLSPVYVALYFMLMLNSRTTEIERVTPDAKLNKARQKNFKTPLLSHRIVTIVPKRFITYEPGDGTHASPRLHWRRSHKRVLHRGETNEQTIVIPRFLVGRRELGEVTHDYVVKLDT